MIVSDTERARLADVVWMNLCCALAASGKNAKRVLMVSANDVAAALDLAIEEMQAVAAHGSILEFCVGDRVEHSTCGPGVVTKIVYNGDTDDERERGVHVTFDRIDTRGRPWRGIYDDNWFRIATCRLTKSTPTPTDAA